MKTLHFFISILGLCLVVSCTSNEPHFRIEGHIENADSSILYLEKRELNKISLLDSIKLDKTGNFNFRSKAIFNPEFYVLRLNKQIINLAIDSVETISVEADKNTFATSYDVKESSINKNIKAITLAQYAASEHLSELNNRFSQKIIDESQYISQLDDIVNEYKKISTKIIALDFKSPAAYFALFQKVNNYLFFDPYDKNDQKLFAAVATAWDTYYKDSPRALHLHDYTLSAMKVSKQEKQKSEEVINSTSIVDPKDYYTINLPDMNNQIVSTDSLIGKVVLVDFISYQSPESPGHNIFLNKLYARFKPNLEIYQVSFDSDVHVWKNAAVNLPWIKVHEAKSIQSDLIFKYNISVLPTVFLINKNGEIVKRLLPSDNIDGEIQKII